MAKTWPHSVIMVCALTLISSAARAELDVAWTAAYDTTTHARFIPVELWTGAAWDGHREITATPAHLSFGREARKSIDGPIEWTRASNGQKLMVYERVNGGKKQLFAISSRGDGIGRVYDSRYDRDCVDEVKFPLGYWHQGEVRDFDVPCNNDELIRKIRVTIEEIDFEFSGKPHSLKFHWQILNGFGKATDMHYTYSPGEGMVSEYGNE
jgi:hypothetical protein